jgi:hypothetical protein
MLYKKTSIDKKTEKRFDSAAQIWLDKTEKIIKKQIVEDQNFDFTVAKYLCDKVLALDQNTVSDCYVQMANNYILELNEYK